MNVWRPRLVAVACFVLGLAAGIALAGGKVQLQVTSDDLTNLAKLAGSVGGICSVVFATGRFLVRRRGGRR